MMRIGRHGLRRIYWNLLTTHPEQQWSDRADDSLEKQTALGRNTANLNSEK